MLLRQEGTNPVTVARRLLHNSSEYKPPGPMFGRLVYGLLKGLTYGSFGPLSVPGVIQMIICGSNGDGVCFRVTL
jgi:hypothetical protein